MPEQIQRYPVLDSPPITVASNPASSTTITMGTSSSLAFVVENTLGSGTQIQWYSSDSQAGPWRQVFLSSEETAYTNIPVAAVYVAPPELFALHYVRGVLIGHPSTVIKLILKG